MSVIKVDCHCHTTESDGRLTPEALLDLAKENQVNVLAITDHDTTSAYIKVKAKAAALGIRLISGVEVSCRWKGHSIHIVALGMDVEHQGLQGLLQQNCRLRLIRARLMAEKLQGRKLPFVLPEVDDDQVVGRANVALWMVEQGIVPNVKAAFDAYLATGKAAFVPSQWPSMAEVIRQIHAAGGISVLAHPNHYRLSKRQVKSLIHQFAHDEGQAIEVVSGRQAPDVVAHLCQKAAQYNLMVSAGSDFHYPGKMGRELGGMSHFVSDQPRVWQVLLD